jgi:hypothetical protein
VQSKITNIKYNSGYGYKFSFIEYFEELSLSLRINLPGDKNLSSLMAVMFYRLRNEITDHLTFSGDFILQK